MSFVRWRPMGGCVHVCVLSCQDKVKKVDGLWIEGSRCNHPVGIERVRKIALDGLISTLGDATVVARFMELASHSRNHQRKSSWQSSHVFFCAKEDPDDDQHAMATSGPRDMQLKSTFFGVI